MIAEKSGWYLQVAQKVSSTVTTPVQSTKIVLTVSFLKTRLDVDGVKASVVNAAKAQNSVISRYTQLFHTMDQCRAVL